MPPEAISPDFLADPHPTFAQLRGHDPVHWSARGGCWIATRYADIKRVLSDPRFGHHNMASREALANGAALSPAVARLAQDAGHLRALEMSRRRPPDHTRLRALLTPFFTQPAVDGLRAYIQTQTDELLDRVQPAGEMDLVADFADHLPFEVACQLLDLPAAERIQVKGWLLTTLSAMGLHPTPAILARGALARVRLGDYFQRLAKVRRKEPGNDPISVLAADPSVAEDELAANSIMLLVGGEVNPRAMIANSVLALLRHPDQLGWLRSHPSMLRTAVEELLRYDNAAQLTARRVALEDVDLGGRTIRRGEGILVFTGAANRDPAQFEHPDRLDLARAPNPHLSFGAGIHGCIGAYLARVELEVALGTLLRRMPDLALQAEPLEWVEGFFPHGPKTLRVSF